MHFNFKQGLFQSKGEILQYIGEDGKEYIPYNYNFEEDIVPEIVISTCFRYRKPLFPVFLKRKLLFPPVEAVISAIGSRYFPKGKPLFPFLFAECVA